jgi:hypothetical protein
MSVISGMPHQPVANFRDFMGAVVVHDEMHIQARGKIVIDLIEEQQELLMPMPAVAITYDHTRGHIHGCEQ